ncbi:hypothetical protein [Alteromonas sp. W364]|uniref:hypothetical protein n=1 Tax=Alteromonas sp. W364 TaxID=3075610 RepID=UPI002883D713|nr:hypothetical protein [Alteromonas sp. W364]MDT0628059.1 hypothetical protein [Alteromonas sp. W364]
MYHFSLYQLALSQLITFDPFEVTFNNQPSLFAALCDTKSDFSSGSMAEKLFDTACVAVILNLGLESLHKIDRSVARNRNLSKTRPNAKHTKPIRRRYYVNFYKHINKLIVIDWLGCHLDISEVIQPASNCKSKNFQKTVHQYLVRAGVLREQDSILLRVRTDRSPS